MRYFERWWVALVVVACLAMAAQVAVAQPTPSQPDDRAPTAADPGEPTLEPLEPTEPPEPPREPQVVPAPEKPTEPPPPPQTVPEPASNQSKQPTATLAAPSIPDAGADVSEVPFRFWQGEDGLYIRPVVQLASGFVFYRPDSDVAVDLSSRFSTLALARFGLEGQPFENVTFRSVFERNIGFSLARNGPVGTSVWEGTSSLSARENAIHIHHRGLVLSGGIIHDPASADYVSSNVLNVFGMDPYVRDPLLVSGFSQGQGGMVRYRRAIPTFGTLTGGLSVGAGNPLTTSLSFGFGGDVSALGTLFSAPLRALSNGIPGSDINVVTFSPSIVAESEWFDARAAFQYYIVDTDVTQSQDVGLTGWNARASTQVNALLEYGVRVFGSLAHRRNEQVAIPDVTTLKADFKGTIAGVGVDYFQTRWSLGSQYYWHRSDVGSGDRLTLQTLNVGGTAWIVDDHVSAGLRWARSMGKRSSDPQPILKTSDSFILSMRLML